MTNVTNSSQWEVAGGKKAAFKRVSSNNELDSKKGKAALASSLPSKIPVLETLKPIKLEGTIYDVFSEEVDDENSEKNAKAKKVQSNGVSKAINVPVSPKKPKQESINLLASSVTNTKKKVEKNTLSPGKKSVSELESKLAQLNFESFQQKYTQLESLFPENLSYIVMHLTAFLNQTLNDIPDIEPNQNHENESNFYPSNKLDKKLEKFFNNLIYKLKRSDLEHVFDYCINEIVKNENPKINSNHGLRIFIQLLLKHNPNIFTNNLPKYVELINLNRHRHQRVMLALWAFSQVGYINLLNGMKVWFEILLPLISVKHFTNYAATYLYSLFEHHKIDSKSLVNKLNNQYVMDLETYLNLYELVNDKILIQNKETAQKLKSSFQNLRILFLNSLSSDESGHYFEDLLLNIPAEESPKQTEFLELLTTIIFSNKNTINRWQNIYSKSIQQSNIFLEYLSLNHSRSLKKLKNMNALLLHFNEQTASQIMQLSASTTKDTSKPYYLNKKVVKTGAELERLKKFNKLVQQLIKQHFKRLSIFSIMFRTFLMFTLLTGLFFYWDVNYNRSVYFNAGQKQLKKYGMLDQTVKVVETVKKTALNVQSMINFYVPIWYKKTSDIILPYTKKTWNMVTYYSNVVWTNSEKYRNNAIFYYQQADKYIQQNFPELIKNFWNTVDLASVYANNFINVISVYTNKTVNFVGTQLMGLKKGELEKVIFDASKVMLNYFSLAMNWINKNLLTMNADL